MRQVLRRLFTMPLFTTIAVGTLAIGIGANAAIFSVIEGVLLKPLPFPSPDALVSVDHAAPGVGLQHAGAAPFLFLTYRAETRAFADVGMWTGDTVSVTGRAEPEEVVCVDVTDRVLPLLGVQPALGRLFSAADDAPGGAETVVLAYGYWRSTFGGDPSVVGQRLLVDGRPREIIGVLPERFRFLDRKPSMFLPLQLDPAKTHLGNFSYSGVARLKPGVTIAQASADVARMIPISLQRFPPFPGYSVKMFEEARLAPDLQPLKAQLVGDIGGVLWILMGTIGLVLLIACANVANLLLVRAEGRQQELAIRAALGAGRAQIARELLLESLTLGVIGGVCGLGLAYGALRVLIASAPGGLPRVDEISIDAAVLAFTLIVSIAAGLLFGSIPIFKYVRPQLAGALRAGGRSLSSSRERHRARNTLVVVQVALALVLLVGSGLMIRSFQALRQVQPGFSRPEEVLTLRISIPESQVHDPDATVRMEQAIADKIAAVPGVTSVALTTDVPMSNDRNQDPIFAEDHVYADTQIPPLRRFKFVSPGVPRTLGNAIVAGHDFTWTDVYEKRPVAIVTENLARELWHDPRAAIGKRIRESHGAPWREIVGIVSDERDDGVDQKAPTSAIFPILMSNFEGEGVAVRRSLAYVLRSSRAGSSGFVDEVSRAVWSVNPNLPVANVRTLKENYDRSMARTSFTLVMLGLAGAMALLLGVAGVYGVISYSVSQRTREIGIRIALGARRSAVTRLFVLHGLRLAAVGVGCGLAAAFALTRLMSSLLFDVRATDPLTYAAVSIGLACAALLASYVPAVQAATVDPVDALRAE
jgi:putative ABC transport system permease protein